MKKKSNQIKDTEHITEIKKLNDELVNLGDDSARWEAKLIIDECRNKLMILRRIKLGYTV